MGGVPMLQVQPRPLQVVAEHGVTSPPPSASEELVVTVPSAATQAGWHEESRQVFSKQWSPSGQEALPVQAISVQLPPPLPTSPTLSAELGLLLSTFAEGDGQPVPTANPTARESAEIRLERCRTLTQFLPSKPPNPHLKAEMLAR